jgi:SAM-dependent methyltransferase
MGKRIESTERVLLQAEPETILETDTRYLAAAGFGHQRRHKGRDARAGCGLRQWGRLFLAARMVGPTGEVVGLDRAPAAVATATRRALLLQLSNTRFVEGDPGEIPFGRPFDAVVGCMVLMFCHDPSDTLCKLAAHVRPGGVIAFQEVDFTGCRSLPTLPTFNRCVRWIAESLERSGSDPYLGLKLYATFRTAGLPVPGIVRVRGHRSRTGSSALLGRCESYSNFVACPRRVGPGDPGRGRC